MTLDQIFSMFENTEYAELTEKQLNFLKHQISLELVDNMENILKLIPYMNKTQIYHMVAEFEAMKKLAEKREVEA